MVSLETAIQDAKKLVRAFLAEGNAVVYIAVARKRLYVGQGPAERFAEGGGTPQNHQVTSEAEVDQLFQDPAIRAEFEGADG